MGLSRRQFTQEFKLAAVRRLEPGVSITEVARGLEVNPNVLHRWRREFRQGPGNAFPDNGKQRWAKARWLNWNVRSASRRWSSIFCSTSRLQNLHAPPGAIRSFSDISFLSELARGSSIAH